MRETHEFLSEADIDFFRPLIRDGLFGAMELACVRDEGDDLVGFAGVSEGKLEALFIHPDRRGTGIGRRLFRHAADVFGATCVDVNEQNGQAVGFYLRLGCVVEGRSEVDSLGKPFPLLHMRLPGR